MTRSSQGIESPSDPERFRFRTRRNAVFAAYQANSSY